MTSRDSDPDTQLSVQAVGSFVAHEQSQRLVELNANLHLLEDAYKSSIEELQKLKDFVGSPSEILGNPQTKHGEIAEQVEVAVRRARAHMDFQFPDATFEGVVRNAPTDYLIGGSEVQSKFYNGARNTLDGVLRDYTKTFAS